MLRKEGQIGRNSPRNLEPILAQNLEEGLQQKNGLKKLLRKLNRENPRILTEEDQHNRVLICFNNEEEKKMTMT